MDGPSTVLARAKGGSILFDEVGDLDDEAQGRIVRMLDTLADSGPRIMATSPGRPVRSGWRTGELPRGPVLPPGGRHPRPCRRCASGWTTSRCSPTISSPGPSATASRCGGCRAQALDLVRAYSWPGNVRQLENAMRRLVVTATEEEITPRRGRGGARQPARDRAAEGRRRRARSCRRSVGKHLRRYFDLHGGVLPPPGLYQRILREVETAADRDRARRDRRKPGQMCRPSRHQPQYLAQEDHRPRYSRDTPPQVDVKPQQTRGARRHNERPGATARGTAPCGPAFEATGEAAAVRRSLTGPSLTRFNRWRRQRRVQNAATLGLVVLGPGAGRR